MNCSDQHTILKAQESPPPNDFENINIKLTKTISVQNSTSNSELAWLFEIEIKKLNKNLGRSIKYRMT